jgi:hypothetical protein
LHERILLNYNAEMYKTCPKCGHERSPADTGDAGICPACGLVFAKWTQRALGTRPARTQRTGAEDATDSGPTLLERLTYVEPRTDTIQFWGRVALYVAFFVWGWYFILLDFRSGGIGQSFMHRVNLVFHEAGHVVFMPFGSFMMTLGGSLGQLIMPAIVMAALIIKNRDNYGASIGLWWLGQSMMDLAPYINDARDLKLMLLGGGTGQDRPGMHDWENILLDLRLIEHDHQIAAGADALGTILVLMALFWGGCMLYFQHRNLPDKA